MDSNWSAHWQALEYNFWKKTAGLDVEIYFQF
jgi:hypothetical protein